MFFWKEKQGSVCIPPPSTLCLAPCPGSDPGPQLVFTSAGQDFTATATTATCTITSTTTITTITTTTAATTVTTTTTTNNNNNNNNNNNSNIKRRLRGSKIHIRWPIKVT